MDNGRTEHQSPLETGNNRFDSTEMCRDGSRHQMLGCNLTHEFIPQTTTNFSRDPEPHKRQRDDQWENREKRLEKGGTGQEIPPLPNRYAIALMPTYLCVLEGLK